MLYVDALSTLAEVSIAIAGFSGIVSVFAHRGSRRWSDSDRNRFVALLALSFTALFFSTAPFVLLSVPVSESTCWKSMSALLLLCRVGFFAVLVRVLLGALRTPQAERDVSLAIAWFFLIGDFLAVGTLAFNIVALGAAWPYLMMITWVLVEAAVSFTRLILTSLSNESPV